MSEDASSFEIQLLRQMMETLMTMYHDVYARVEALEDKNEEVLDILDHSSRRIKDLEERCPQGEF